MKSIIYLIIFIFAGQSLMAIEELEYKVLEKDERYEIRQYEDHILAEVEVEGSAKDAGNKAFSLLFKYISGENKTRSKLDAKGQIQQEKSQKISMTAPVNQEQVGDKWLVSFVMPSKYTMDSLPEPKNERVKLREVKGRKMVALRYSGTWSEKRYLAHKNKLIEYMKEKSLQRAGEVVWARYNSPFSLWFLRRNEVLYPIK